MAASSPIRPSHTSSLMQESRPLFACECLLIVFSPLVSSLISHKLCRFTHDLCLASLILEDIINDVSYSEPLALSGNSSDRLAISNTRISNANLTNWVQYLCYLHLRHVFDCVRVASTCRLTIFTLGTTGKPKGVDVTHLSVVNLLLTDPGRVGMRPGRRVAQLLNVAFDMAQWECLGSIANGCTLCIRGSDWKSVMSR